MSHSPRTCCATPQGVAARPPSPESHGARLNLPGTSSLQGFAALFIAQNDENLCLLQEKCHGPGPHLSLLLPPIPLQGEPSVFSSGPSECHGQTKSHLCGWLQDRVAATAAWVDPGAGLRWLRGTLLPGPLFGNSGWGARDLCWAPARCLSACQAHTMSSLPPMPQWGGGGGTSQMSKQSHMTFSTPRSSPGPEPESEWAPSLSQTLERPHGKFSINGGCPQGHRGI